MRPNERVDLQSWARPDQFVRYGRRALVGLRADNVKAVSIERFRLSLSLSSCRKTFKLKKVNKSFVPEPISCFRIPIYFMNIVSISHTRIMGMLHVYSILSVLTWRQMPPAACSRISSRDSAWVDVFARSTMSSAQSAFVIA